MRLLGLFLFIGLAAWVIYGLAGGGVTYPQLAILGLGDGFEGNLALPKETIQAAIENYRNTVLSAADNASYFKFGSQIASWLAFAATAAITLVAGWFGHAPPPANGGLAAPAVQGLPPKATRLVTLLAAAAAVLTAGAGLASQEGQDLYAWARDRQRDLVQGRADILAAETAEAAQTVLDDLELQLRQ